MVADIEELEEMDASELHARRLKAKEVLTRDRPERGEEQEILQGKSDGLHSPTPLQEDSTRDDEEAKVDFWTITGEFG